MYVVTPRQGALGCTRKVAEQARITKSMSSIPLGFCFKPLPRIPTDGLKLVS